MKKFGFFSFLAIAIYMLASTASVQAQALLTIQNNSDWDIYYIYISKSTDSSWGDDLLGSEVLYSGSSKKFSFHDAGEYDIKLIDEDDDECIIFKQWLDGKETWYIENDELLECMGY